MYTAATQKRVAVAGLLSKKEWVTPRKVVQSKQQSFAMPQEDLL